MHNRLVESVLASCRGRGLAAAGDRVLVGLSGGLDSVVLLHVLGEAAGTIGFELEAAHVNHGLRGRASGADARFVRALCRRQSLKCTSARAQVRALARREKLSIEMAARRERHRLLAEIAAARRCDAVALAHHADDQVELFFLRLLRGASGAAMGGMDWSGPSPADARVRLIRPLLDQPKSALLHYARAHRLQWREDASNQDLGVPRNWIRHKLIPDLTRQAQTALLEVVPRVMATLAAEHDFVREAAAKILGAKGSNAFNAAHPAVQRAAIAAQLRKSGWEPRFDWIEQLRLNPRAPLEVGPGHRLVRRMDGRLEALTVAQELPSEESRAIPLTGSAGSFYFRGKLFKWSKLSTSGRSGWQAFLKSRQGAGVEWFDAAKIGAQVVVRGWRPGDRFRPIGMSHAVKVQDLFTNARVPRAERHRRVVASTADGVIFWIEGLRIAELFKLDKATVDLIKWEWIQACGEFSQTD